MATSDGMGTDAATGHALAPGAATPWGERFFESADGLRLHYRDYPTERGNPARLPVLCLHGLTRNSRDFERLAPHLQRERRVLAADLRGRGQSARDPDWRNYQPGVYLADLAALLDDARAARVVIVGTSLGGLLAMLFAAREPARVAGIVLNDIGPEIDPVGRTRIATYVGRSAPVRNWDEAVNQARATYEQCAAGVHGQRVAHAREAQLCGGRRGAPARHGRDDWRGRAQSPVGFAAGSLAGIRRAVPGADAGIARRALGRAVRGDACAHGA